MLAFQWQCVHFCNIICLFRCSTIKMIITVLSLLSVAQAWTLIKQFYGLLGPKLATLGGEKFPFPSQVYRLLGTKVNLTVSPREIQVLPSRVDSICCELKQILASKKLSKGHASEVFGKLSFSAGQLFWSIWTHASCAVQTPSIRERMAPLTSHLKSNVRLDFGCLFCLVARFGQFRRILAHRLSLQ